MANVVPVLGKEPESHEWFYASLHIWLQNFTLPTIVADWPADLIHFFAALMGTSHDKTLQYPCLAILDTSIDYESAIPHNALEDARAIRRAVRSEA